MRAADRGLTRFERRRGAVMSAWTTTRAVRGAGITRLVFSFVVCFLLVPASARGQTPPAGNAHPQAQAVSQAAAELSNPFGEPSFQPVAGADVASKAAFAAELDLSPLRGVAVFHSGRVKILDTLARETVLEITGRARYQDVIEDSLGHETVSFDPLFTLLDLIIDPVWYVDRPLLHVEHLPLRRAFVEAALAGDRGGQQRLLMLTRITPRIAAEQFLAINDRVLEGSIGSGSVEQFRRGLDRLNQSQLLWSESASNMVLVAPEGRDHPWHHLSEPAPSGLDEQSAADWARARAAALALGQAWRARDAAGVNRAAADLSEALPRINGPMYPSSRRWLELTYNRVRAFEWGMWLYFGALIGLVLAFGTARRSLAGVGMVLLLGAVAMHAFGFVSRCILAERFAIQNQFESMTGVSLFAALVGVVLAGATRRWLFGAAAAATGFLVLIAATQTGIPGRFIEREAAILNTSVLLKYHVTTVLTSYGLITLGMIVSLFYLGTHYAGKRAVPSLFAAAVGPGGVLGEVPSGGAPGAGALDSGEAGARHRLLRDLDRAQMIVLQLAFWTLAVGILLGAWWADHSWGRWWAFDPKETWALITWIIYLIVIHVRLTTGRNRALVTAWLSVVGFVMMLWTYFGVNLLLPGLHAYA